MTVSRGGGEIARGGTLQGGGGYKKISCRGDLLHVLAPSCVMGSTVGAPPQLA